MRSRALVAIAAFACAAAAGAQGPERVPERVPAAPLLPGTVAGPPPLGYAERGSTTTIERGARLRVHLDADRSTAQRWWLEGVEGGALVVHGSPVFASPNFRDPRAPGNWVFEFQAATPGRSTMRFAFRTAGEPASAATRTAEYHVDVVERAAP